MQSHLVPVVNDIAAIASIIGLFVTAFLVFEARKIRKSFVRRARLPSLTSDLDGAASAISDALKDWSNDQGIVIEQFAKVKGLLENARGKVPTEEKKTIEAFLRLLQLRKGFRRLPLSSLSKRDAGDRYTELRTLIERLSQLLKDTEWD